MRYLLLVAVLILSQASLLAQSSWKEGWCITQKGDTLFGQILFIDWDVSPSEIMFRDTLQNQQRFGANNLKSFSLNYNNEESIFEAKRVNVSTFSIMPVAYGGKIVSVDTVSRFLELKFGSDLLSFYLLNDDNQVPHYYILKNEVITELEFGKVTLIRDTKPMNYTSYQYRNQLKRLLEECPTLDVSQVNYSDKSIIRLLTEYHSYCKVDYSVMHKSYNKTIVNLGVSVGNFLGHPEFEGHALYNFDIALRFLIPKRFNNQFIQLDIGQFVSEDIVIIKNNKIKHYTWHLGANCGTYFGNDKKKLLPFVAAGFSNVVGLYFGAGLSVRKRLDVGIQTKILLNAEPIIGFTTKLYPFKFSN